MKPPVIAIHRGRNRTTSLLVNSVTSKDYNFDFRGISGGSKLDLFWLLLKAWIQSKEIPEAKIYLVEGGMLFWVGYFLKKKFPQAKLYLIVPEPAFFDDQRKSRIKKIFFRFKIRKIKESVDLLLPNSMMIYRDAERLFGEPFPFKLLRYPTATFEQVVFGANKKIMFVIERPEETGYMKGYDVVLQIFEKVRHQHPTAELIVVGLGSESCTDAAKNIYGMGRMNMTEAFKLASIIIAPARYDAFLMAIPEAASAGLIPMVSRGVGAQDLFPEYHKSFIIDHRDIDLWAKKIDEAFTLDSNYRDRLRFDFTETLKLYKAEPLVEELRAILEGPI